jgi:hypothetical protein
MWTFLIATFDFHSIQIFVYVEKQLPRKSRFSGFLVNKNIYFFLITNHNKNEVNNFFLLKKNIFFS